MYTGAYAGNGTTFSGLVDHEGSGNFGSGGKAAKGGGTSVFDGRSSLTLAYE